MGTITTRAARRIGNGSGFTPRGEDPTRRGDAIDAAITDARGALATIHRIAHELVQEKVRESMPGGGS